MCESVIWQQQILGRNIFSSHRLGHALKKKKKGECGREMELCGHKCLLLCQNSGAVWHGGEYLLT